MATEKVIEAYHKLQKETLKYIFLEKKFLKKKDKLGKTSESSNDDDDYDEE